MPGIQVPNSCRGIAKIYLFFKLIQFIFYVTLTIFDTKEDPEHAIREFRILTKYPLAALWCDIKKMDPDYFLEVHNESS